MRRIRTVILLSGLAATVGAQATTRPRTAVAGAAVRTAGADLVIDSLDLVLSRGASAMANANGVQVKGLVFVARVTNRGTERWASRGAIGFSLKAGGPAHATNRGLLTSTGIGAGTSSPTDSRASSPTGAWVRDPPGR